MQWLKWYIYIYHNSQKCSTSVTNKQRRTTLLYRGSPPEPQLNRNRCRLYYRGSSDWWRYCLKHKWAIHKGEVTLVKLCCCWLWSNLTHGYNFFEVLVSWKHPTVALWNVPRGNGEQKQNKKCICIGEETHVYCSCPCFNHSEISFWKMYIFFCY